MNRFPWLHVPFVQVARTHTHMRLSARSILQGVHESLTSHVLDFVPPWSLYVPATFCMLGATVGRGVHMYDMCLKTLGLLADAADVSMHVLHCTRSYLGLNLRVSR
jgi:hypothetical protein